DERTAALRLVEAGEQFKRLDGINERLADRVKQQCHKRLRRKLRQRFPPDFEVAFTAARRQRLIVVLAEVARKRIVVSHPPRQHVGQDLEHGGGCGGVRIGRQRLNERQLDLAVILCRVFHHLVHDENQTGAAL